MKISKETKKNISKHPFLSALALSIVLGTLCCAAPAILTGEMAFHSGATLSVIIAGCLIGAVVIYPVVLTIIEFFLLFRLHGQERLHKKGILFDISAVVMGIPYSLLYLGILQHVQFGSNWNEILANAQQHTPIYTQDIPTVLFLFVAGIAGYAIVNTVPLPKMPPLLLVLGISAMYLGTLENIIWGYQVCNEISLDICLLLLPLNCVLITARTVIYKIREWNALPRELHKINQVPFLGYCNRILDNAALWPFAAFLLMWPLLGILICILVLFGQSPSAAIRAWTETSDWNLSQKVAPQNIYYDEHYLCTVAAGGHKRIVKPLRPGLRHGHQVIVNRQLCVANAFEQILEEKMPRLHRTIRHLYDRYGFPVARLIHSQYAADFIYFLMKPLEWIFLAVLYLTDTHPEDRIAVQYMRQPPLS